MDISIEMAPLEGVTTSFFRQTMRRHFTMPERCYTPFISPTQDRCFTAREMKEISPENNEGICVIPQLIGHNAEDFLWAANELKAMGYGEVNLNLGCPSGTVTKKKKGAGLLGDIPMLTDFLDRIFDGTPLPVSIKTRVGRTDHSEAYALAELFSRYPAAELIVHPRIEKDFYKGAVSMECFEVFRSKNPDNICFNGDIFNRSRAEEFACAYPDVKKIMCGRGMIANPKLAGELKGEAPLTKTELHDFYEDLFETTVSRLSGEKQIMLHMKEYWAYWGGVFTDPGAYLKKVFKSKTLPEYISAVSNLFSACEVSDPAGFVQV